jgi:hypothetical protein
VLREEGQLDKARDMLAESVRAYPWNWSAWLDLAALPSLSWEHIASLNLPHHIMRYPQKFPFIYIQVLLIIIIF